MINPKTISEATTYLVKLIMKCMDRIIVEVFPISYAPEKAGRDKRGTLYEYDTKNVTITYPEGDVPVLKPGKTKVEKSNFDPTTPRFMNIDKFIKECLESKVITEKKLIEILNDSFTDTISS